MLHLAIVGLEKTIKIDTVELDSILHLVLAKYVKLCFTLFTGDRSTHVPETPTPPEECLRPTEPCPFLPA